MNKLSYFSKPNEKNLSNSEELNDIWQQVTKLRYDVFAEELQQYSTNVEKRLDEPGQHCEGLLGPAQPKPRWLDF